MAVAEHLHLDVLRARDVSLQEHIRPAERRVGFALRFFELAFELGRRGDDAHPASAAAEAGLDHERIADACGFSLDVAHLLQRPIGSGHRRHARRLRRGLCRRLVAEHVEVRRRRAHEPDSRLLARTRERRALGEKPVAGMNGIDALLLRDRDERLDVQVRAHRLAALGRPDEKCLVCLEPVQRETIFVAVDRDRSQAQLGGGPETPDGDFGPVGDEEFPHGVSGIVCRPARRGEASRS